MRAPRLQLQVRRFCRKGVLGREAFADVVAWQYSGFSVDASVRKAPTDQRFTSIFLKS